MKDSIILKASFLAVFGAALSGCAVGIQTNPEDMMLPNSNALDELVQVSIEARDELRLLAKTKESLAQEAMTKEQHEQRFLQATQVPQGFERKGMLKYAGKASEAARALAAATGYKFMIDGKPMVDEPWVFIDIKNEPYNEALKELGLQTGDRIRIEVHSKILRFVYK